MEMKKIVLGVVIVLIIVLAIIYVFQNIEPLIWWPIFRG